MQTTRTVPAKRFAALLAELDAVASCELAPELAWAHAGTPLGIDALDRLEMYVREEMQADGLLSLDHLAGPDAYDRQAGRKIHRQAIAFLDWLGTLGTPTMPNTLTHDIAATVEGTGEVVIPSAFADDFGALSAALDWARVYNTTQDFYRTGQELAAARRHALAIAELCADFAQSCHDLER